MPKDEIKIRRKWTWKVKQWETTRNVKSEPDVRLIYKMRSEIFHHLELFSQLTRRKEKYEWLLAINPGNLIVFNVFPFYDELQNAELFKVY